MRRAWVAGAAVLALTLTGCVDEGGSDEPEQVDPEADAEALVDCLARAGMDAVAHVRVDREGEVHFAVVSASDLSSELLKRDTGDGAKQAVKLWVYKTEADAEEPRAMHTSLDPAQERVWAVGRAVVNWDYPVNRDAIQAVAVDDCVAELN